VAQEINEPRLPPVMQIMAAGRKQIPVEAVSLDSGEYTKIISNTALKSERKKKIFEKPDDGVAEVVKVLKEEIR
jgi:Electron transfer flavoprotein, beta subunit